MSRLSKRVLIVDDDPVCRDITRRILSHELADFAVEFVEATNGAEGIEVAKRQPGPDVILMDLAMPVLSGTAAISMLKADPETANIPVIAITAMVLPRESESLLQLGFDGYVPKPIEYDKLVQIVRTILSIS